MTAFPPAISRATAVVLGVSNGHKIFQLLAKFGLCSQNLDECSLARARKIFAIARMLVFSLIDFLKFSRGWDVK